MEQDRPSMPLELRDAIESAAAGILGRIGDEHPALARHIENAIHTGTFRRHHPDRPLRWEP